MALLVSVILPAHNVERTIERTLYSVRTQTCRDIEIIVIDDGSTDRTAAIVEAEARCDPRIVLIKQPNRGVAAARNAGIAAARAAFLAPIDADDLWSPDKLEAQLAVFDEGDDDLGLVYCRFAVIDMRDRILWYGPECRYDGDVLADIAREDFVGNGSNAMMRTAMVREIGGYDETLRQQHADGSEDWLIALQLAEIGQFGAIDEPLVGYRLSRGTLSSKARAMAQSAQIIAERYSVRYPDLVPMFQAHMHDRVRWLFIRAASDLNLLEVSRLMRVAHRPMSLAQLLGSALGPAALQLARNLMRAFGLRNFKPFQYGNADETDEKRFS